MAFVFENLTPWKMSLWNRPRMATIWEEEPEPEDDYYSEAPETLVDPTPSEPEPCWGEDQNSSEPVKPFVLFENTVWGNLNFVPENEPPSSRTLRELRKQYISHYSPPAKLVCKISKGAVCGNVGGEKTDEKLVTFERGSRSFGICKIEIWDTLVLASENI